jgi:hypothetical protein
MTKKLASFDSTFIISELVLESDIQQKNKVSTMVFFANPVWVGCRPLKRTKTKDGHHF